MIANPKNWGRVKICLTEWTHCANFLYYMGNILENSFWIWVFQIKEIIEPRHVISSDVTFWQV